MTSRAMRSDRGEGVNICESEAYIYADDDVHNRQGTPPRAVCGRAPGDEQVDVSVEIIMEAESGELNLTRQRSRSGRWLDIDWPQKADWMM